MKPISANLLVYNDVDLHTSLSSPLENLVQTPFLIVEGGSPQEQFRRDPPVLQVDDLLGLVERNRDRPEIVQSIDIPLEVVVLANWGVGLESMRLRNVSSLFVGRLLVLFVMAMVGIQDVEELSELVLHVMGLGSGIVETGVCPQFRSVRVDFVSISSLRPLNCSSRLSTFCSIIDLSLFMVVVPEGSFPRGRPAVRLNEGAQQVGSNE